MSLHVLLIAADSSTHSDVAARLRSPLSDRTKIELTVATSWQIARVRLVLEAFDAVVLADRVADASAVEILTALADLPHPPVIALARDGELDGALRVLRAGAADCIMRHLNDWTLELRLAIERLTESARRRGTLAERSAGANEYASVLAALLLRRQQPSMRAAYAGA